MTYSMKSIDNNSRINKDYEGIYASYPNFTIRPYLTDGHNNYCLITNTSDSTLYIDLGESYYLYNSQANRLFSNSITTTFGSGTVGTGVNVGSIANAVGIGGIAGEIANGINVGGNRTKGKSIQQIEERFISIPPKSNYKVNTYFTPISKSLLKKKKKGTYHYSEYSSDSHEYLFTYTFDINSQKMSISRNKLYLSQIDAGNNPSFKSNQYYRVKYRDNTGMWCLIGAIGGGVGLGLLCK